MQHKYNCAVQGPLPVAVAAHQNLVTEVGQVEDCYKDEIVPMDDYFRPILGGLLSC